MKYFYLTIFLILTLSCSSWKKSLVETGTENDAIHNAIIDFQKSGYYEKRNVFSIMSLQINDSILAVSIFPTNDPLSINGKDVPGSKSKYFPSRYVMENERLFYWRDSTYALKSDLMENLAKFRMIDSTDYSDGSNFPRMNFNDHYTKAVNYYFCASNLKKYRKVKSSIALGWGKPLKVKCN